MLGETAKHSTLLMRKKPNPVFIADPSPQFLEGVWSDPQAQQVPPIVVQNGKEAQGVLGQFKKPFSGIFINPDISDPHGVSVVRAAHHYHPAVPIFFLSDKSVEEDNQIFPEESLKHLGIQRIIRKPITFAEILKLVTPPSMIFNPNDAIAVSLMNEDPLEAEIDVKDNAFFSTRIENFLAGALSFFDVYIKLPTGKFVKVLRAGDSFSSDRVVSYIKRGVTHFYIRKEAQEHYLNFCDKLVSAIIKSPKISTKVKISQTFHHGEETVDFLRNHGLSNSSIEYACGFVGNVDQLVKQLETQKPDILKPFLNDLISYDHGVGVAMIASLIMKEMNMENEKAVQTIGLASLLHDIGLQSLPTSLKKEDDSEMTDGERKVYQMHSSMGAKVLERVPGIDPIVPQAVEQHHERRNRSGFPKQLGATSILQIAEIVGISDELFRLIQKQKQDPQMEPFLAMLNVFDGFSIPVVQAFRSVFINEIK